jgi:hypothetical protein
MISQIEIALGIQAARQHLVNDSTFWSNGLILQSIS